MQDVELPVVNLVVVCILSLLATMFLGQFFKRRGKKDED
jgi:uncharacterized protein YneF (UPF0154 family)